MIDMGQCERVQLKHRSRHQEELRNEISRLRKQLFNEEDADKCLEIYSKMDKLKSQLK